MRPFTQDLWAGDTYSLAMASIDIASHDSAEAISPFCPCEEHSDEANLGELYEIATLRSQ